MFLLSIAGFIFAPHLLTLFRRNDPDVISIGTFAMRAQCIILPLLPMTTISNMTFQVIGRSRSATFLSSARQGIYFLPLILILPRIIGLRGVQLTQTFADLLTFITCIFFLVPFLRELSQKASEQTALNQNI